jgi:hypothetical protein
MPNQIISPAGYTPVFAMSYSDEFNTTQIVTNAAPLPVAQVVANKPAAFTGTASVTTQVGPFAPLPGQPVMLVLSGTWTGTVSLLRSTDGGTTRRGVTALGRAWGQFTTNACEPVWEEAENGAALYLDIALLSGSVAYRLAQ